jgi:hypothetical protein
MHNLALGRARGDFEKDGLQGCRGVGGILDNRVITLETWLFQSEPRCFALGTASVNGSHINRKGATTVTAYPDVVPSGQNWTSNISFDGRRYHLGTFPTEVDAVDAFACVQAARRTLESRLSKVPMEAEASIKKTLRAANCVIVKSFIKFDDNRKPSLHDNVKVIRDQLTDCISSRYCNEIESIVVPSQNVAHWEVTSMSTRPWN